MTTKKELIEIIATESHVKKQDVIAVLDTLTRTVYDELKAHGEVNLHGIGRMVVVNKEAREARHPRTGEVVQVAASKAVKMRFASAVKDAVNK